MSSGKQPRNKGFLELIRERKGPKPLTATLKQVPGEQSPAHCHGLLRDGLVCTQTFVTRQMCHTSLGKGLISCAGCQGAVCHLETGTLTWARCCRLGFMAEQLEINGAGNATAACPARQPGLLSSPVTQQVHDHFGTFISSPAGLCHCYQAPHSREEPGTSCSFVLLRCPIRCKELQKNLVPVKTWAGQNRKGFG